MMSPLLDELEIPRRWQILVIISVLLVNLGIWSCYVYFAIVDNEWIWRLALKWIPAFLLLIQTLVLSLMKHTFYWKLCLFYCLCIIGDVLMIFNPMMFLMTGMIFFGLAYLVLTWIAYPSIQDFSSIGRYIKWLLSCAPYCLLGIINLPILLPVVSQSVPLLIGVMIYSCIMLIAGTITLMSAISSLYPASILIAVGTALMIVADTLLIENIMIFSSLILKIVTISLYWMGIMMIGITPLL